jgi:hypothetical protein
MQQQLQEQQQPAEAAAQLPDPQLFAAVVGAASEQERARSAKAAAERQVAGGCVTEQSNKQHSKDCHVKGCRGSKALCQSKQLHL